ncbi:hypothetical protein Y032_0565g15 [Ancylostoma ceylanicum]|uniref:Helitron helicase-like domain-containing protein n=1 Tax=Ancylostoma ceylanicum TaxID=53326 RepID=A0A016WPQ6_9BILA|nr:hypothetical protein Y032_0565g15 [Ancylostoma ceylanicum]
MPKNGELDNEIRVYPTGRGGVIPHRCYDIDAFSFPLLFPGAEHFPEQKLLREVSSSKSEDTISDEKHGSPPHKGTVGMIKGNDHEEYDCSIPPDKEEPDERNDASTLEKSRKRMSISQKEHSLFITACRGNIPNNKLLDMGKLFAQNATHLLARIEADRISAIVHNWTEIRSATASAMYNYMDQRLREKGVVLGRLVTLPTYVGSRNWCRKQYSVGMTVAQRLGKPDLFITFTSNSEWSEILENLPTGMDSWLTEPLLCVRVFELKLKQFLKELTVDETFGPLEAYQLSIEFQKKRYAPCSHPGCFEKQVYRGEWR